MKTPNAPDCLARLYECPGCGEQKPQGEFPDDPAVPGLCAACDLPVRSDDDPNDELCRMAGRKGLQMQPTSESPRHVGSSDLVRRIAVLENALAAAADELHMLSQYRKRAHEYDRDMDHGERLFADEEDWGIMESIAETAKQAALLKLRETSPNDPSSPPPP